MDGEELEHYLDQWVMGGGHTGGVRDMLPCDGSGWCTDLKW